MNDNQNDQFLSRLREAPNANFASALQQKLSKIPITPERRPYMFFQTLTRKTKLAWAAVLLALSILLPMTITPVRAFVAGLFVEVTGQGFEITDRYPGSAADETIIPAQVLPLTEALAGFPHDVQLPSYVPAGYNLDEENVRLYAGAEAGPFADTLELRWWNDDRTSSLGLRVSSHDLTEIVAPETTEEIALDAEHSVALIRGSWDYAQQAWGESAGDLRLRWLDGGLSYDLSGDDLDELIAVAQSMLR